MIEITCTVIICVTVVLCLIVYAFGSYVNRRGPIRAWKKASLEGFLYNRSPGHGKVMVVTPKGRLAAKDFECEMMDKAETDEVVVRLTGVFPKHDLELYI